MIRTILEKTKNIVDNILSLLNFCIKRITKKNIIKKYVLNFLIIFLYTFFKLIITVHLILIILVFIFSLLYSHINPPLTSLMIYRKIFYKYDNQKIIYIPKKNISRRIWGLLITIEDGKFYEHNGIDLDAIKNAYKVNKKLGYKYLGGSTITQQLARTLFLIPKKNYIRKYLEVIIALEMNRIIEKDRILELYLNNVEFGKGIYGIGRASYYYYGKSYYRLNNNQKLRLLAIIPSPIKNSPYNFKKHYALNSRYNSLLKL